MTSSIHIFCNFYLGERLYKQNIYDDMQGSGSVENSIDVIVTLVPTGPKRVFVKYFVLKMLYEIINYFSLIQGDASITKMTL